MKNPAYALAEIFEGWVYGGDGGDANLPLARRRYAQEREVTEYEVVLRGMECLVEIDERIEELQAAGIDVSFAVYGISRWQAAFLTAAQTQNGQRANNPTSPIPADHFMHLKAFASLIEANAAGLTPRPEFVASIEAAITAAEEFVREVEVTEENRHYLLACLARIRAALYAGRPAEMRAAVNEFVGATVAQEQQATDASEQGKWADVRSNILRPVLTGAAGGVLTQGFTAVVGLIG